MPAITQLLDDWRKGNQEAFGEAIDYLYHDLRRAAAGCLRSSQRNSLQPTLLIHEAYLRLSNSMPGPLRDRKHFLALAAKVMRSVLVDHVREGSALKRGGGSGPPLPLDEATAGMEVDLDQFLVLDQALSSLEQTNPDWARVIEFRYFGGLDLAETAEALGVSVATVTRRQKVAEAWLQRELTTHPK